MPPQCVRIPHSAFRTVRHTAAPPIHPALCGYIADRPQLALCTTLVTVRPANRSTALLAAPTFSRQLGSGIMCSALQLGLQTRLLADAIAVYTARKNALCEELRAHLPAGCRFVEPGGGYFVWIEADGAGALPAGTPAPDWGEPARAQRAAAAGVAFACGSSSSCSKVDYAHCLRLSFCYYDEAALRDGARRLCGFVRAEMELLLANSNL